MSVKLDTPIKNAVHISELKNGQIAEILSWCSMNDSYKGMIIQRCGNHLFGIGSGSYWGDYFTGPGKTKNDTNATNIIRILKSNETITITEN